MDWSLFFQGLFGGLAAGTALIIVRWVAQRVTEPSIWQDVWVQEGNHHRERIVEAAMNWKNDKKNSKEELRAAVEKFEAHLNEITDGRDPFAPVKVVKRETPIRGVLFTPKKPLWKDGLPSQVLVSEVERHPFSCSCVLCTYLEDNYPDLAVQVLSKRHLR